MTAIHTIKNNFGLPITRTISMDLYYSKEQYIYDAFWRIIEHCSFNKENILINKTTYQNTYNEQNHITAKTETFCVYEETKPYSLQHLRSTKWDYLHSYDAEKQLTKKKCFRDNQPSYETTYSYDNGKIETIKKYNAQKKIVSIENFTYNDGY